MIQSISSVSLRNTYPKMASTGAKKKEKPQQIVVQQDPQMYELYETIKTQNDKRNLLLAGGVIGLIGTIAAIMFSAIGGKGHAAKNAAINVSKEFESLAGIKEIPTLDECKKLDKNLREILMQRVNIAQASPELREKLGMNASENRFMLCGSPGVGKTFFGKIFAKSIDADFMEIKFSDFNSRWAGEDIEKMQSLFENIITTAESNPKKHYVVVFNEIDTSIQPLDKLKNSGMSGHIMSKIEERSTLLNYLDDISNRAPNVTIIGTTNQLDGLDGAVLSRFDSTVEVKFPEKDSLKEVLEFNLKFMDDGDKFIQANQDKIEKLAEDMAARKCSFRDLNKTLKKSKSYYLADLLKDKDTVYSFDYLEKGLKSLTKTDGEIK